MRDGGALGVLRGAPLEDCRERGSFMIKKEVDQKRGRTEDRLRVWSDVFAQKLHTVAKIGMIGLICITLSPTFREDHGRQHNKAPDLRRVVPLGAQGALFGGHPRGPVLEKVAVEGLGVRVVVGARCRHELDVGLGNDKKKERAVQSIRTVENYVNFRAV